MKAEQQLKYPKSGEKGLKPIPIDVKCFTPIDDDIISSSDPNLALEKNNHNQASNRVNELLGKMMDVSHTTMSTWEFVKNNANEKQIQDLRNGKVTGNKVVDNEKRKAETIDSAGQICKFQILGSELNYHLLRRLSGSCNTYQNTRWFCIPDSLIRHMQRNTGLFTKSAVNSHG